MSTRFKTSCFSCHHPPLRRKTPSTFVDEFDDLVVTPVQVDADGVSAVFHRLDLLRRKSLRNMMMPQDPIRLNAPLRDPRWALGFPRHVVLGRKVIQ